MASLAELYVRLDPYEASEDEYQRLGEHVHEMAIGAALQNYGGDVTVEVTIIAGSAKIKVRVMQAILALDLIYGHMADWKGFKEQVISTYESSVSFLKTMAETVPDIAKANPRQVKRVEKRYKASGKLKELVERVEQLRVAKVPLETARPLLREIQRLAAEAEKDLTDEERTKLLEGMSQAVPELDDEHLVSGAAMKVALPPVAPKLPLPESTQVAGKPAKGRRRKSKVVFHKSTDLPRTKRIPR
jgi:hypothetical protein